jgi:hypothetical protein
VFILPPVEPQLTNGFGTFKKIGGFKNEDTKALIA